MYKTASKPENWKRRFVWFLGRVGGVVFGVNWAYVFLGIAFSTVPRDYQWILALLSPLFREFWVWIAPKPSYKASGTGSGGNTTAKFLTQHYMETKHAVFLAVILGGVATPETTYCILGMDSLINMYHSLKIIIKMKNKSYSREEGTSFD